MGSTWGPTLANVLMLNLERCLVPTPKTSSVIGKVNTITFINVGSTEHILSLLNSFHSNIKFTYETECNSPLPFLDVTLCREKYRKMYRKVKNKNVYSN